METKLVDVDLYDYATDTTYKVTLTAEDADKCEKDIKFAQNLLNDLKSKEDVSSWSHQETVALIDTYERHRENFQHPKKRKKVWEDISNELVSMGINKTAYKCETKWRNLLRTYKNIKDMKNKTGHGSSRFLFYDQLDEILGDKPAMGCSHTFSTTNLALKETPNTTSETEHFQNIRNPKKRKRTTDDSLKKKTEEWIQFKLNYFKNKEEREAEKQKNKEETQKKLLELEERKIVLLEQYLSK